MQGPKGTDGNAAGRKDYLSRCKARADGANEFDVVLSYAEAHQPELYKIIAAELGKDYKVGGRGVKAIDSAARLVCFLSPPYFSNEACRAEFCEAVKAGVEVVLVCVDGSEWQGQPFPALTDVPAGETREAASVLFGITIAIEHRRSYLAGFVEKLRQRLGPPASLKMAGGGAAKSAAPARSEGVRYDAFLSHKRSEAQDIVSRVHDKLVDDGYRAFIDRNDLVELPSLKLAVRDTGTFVAFLTPNYFKSAWCCLEVCQAVESGVPFLFVVVEGWDAM